MYPQTREELEAEAEREAASGHTNYMATALHEIDKLEDKLKEFGEVALNIVPGNEGMGVEVSSTPDSLRAHIAELQSEWDSAEKECGRLRREIESVKLARGPDEGDFAETLTQLAKNQGELNSAMAKLSGSYNHYNKITKDYKECMDRTEKLYLETLKTIERTNAIETGAVEEA